MTKNAIADRLFGQLSTHFHSLDSMDLQVIEGIRASGPGNITAIARVLGVAPSTVSRRLDNLSDSLHLQTMTNLAYDKLGMKRAVLAIEPAPEDENEAMRRALAMGYHFQSYKILGSLGHLVGFKIPDRLYSTYESMLLGLKNLYSIRSISIHPLGNIVGVGPSFKGYDAEKKKWLLGWKDLKKKLTEAEPLVIKDPENYSIGVDQLDILILFSLESNARTSLSEIADNAGVSIPTISERVKKLTNRGLILSYVCNLLLFPGEDSRLLQLMLSFPSERETSRFASGLLETPFLLSFQKEIGRNTLFVRAYVPNNDYPAFSGLLNDLARDGILTEFSIIELDVESEQTTRISPELFDPQTHWKMTI